MDNNSNAAPKTNNTTRPCFAFNDHYLAFQIAQLHGSSIRYCRKLGGFFVWDGERWVKDEAAVVWRATISAAWTLYHNAKGAASETERARLRKWIIRAERCGSVENTMKQLQALPDILTTADAFDADPPGCSM